MAEIRKHRPKTSAIGEAVRAALGETVRPLTPGEQPTADAGPDTDPFDGPVASPAVAAVPTTTTFYFYPGSSGSAGHAPSVLALDAATIAKLSAPVRTPQPRNEWDGEGSNEDAEGDANQSWAGKAGGEPGVQQPEARDMGADDAS